MTDSFEPREVKAAKKQLSGRLEFGDAEGMAAVRTLQQWSKALEGGPQEYTVEVEFTAYGSQEVVVSAHSPQEAKERAEDEFDISGGSYDLDVSTTIVSVGQARSARPSAPPVLPLFQKEEAS